MNFPPLSLALLDLQLVNVKLIWSLDSGQSFSHDSYPTDHWKQPHSNKLSQFLVYFFFSFISFSSIFFLFSPSGPTALVQLSLWERGSPATDWLKKQLLHAMQCAVCDIVTEYRLLTAPVCEVPPHYTRHGVDSPMHSAPPSPMGGMHTNGKLSHSGFDCSPI